MRIAVLILQGIGDALMCTVALDALRRYRPDDEIHVVTMQDDVRDMFRTHKCVDAVHLLPFFSLGKIAVLREAIRLRSLRFDASVLMFPAVRKEYHYLHYALGARTRVAHNPLVGLFPLFKPNCALPWDAGKHNVENNVSLLNGLGIRASATSEKYIPPPAWLGSGERSRAVGIHVGSMRYRGNEGKRWPLDNYVTLINAIHNRGFNVRLISGPHEREDTQYVAQRAGTSDIIEGSVERVARTIGSLGAVVSADTGIAHISAAVSTPCVVLFGPTNPTHCRPWGSDVEVVRPSDCPPCFRFEDSRFDCKLQIDYRCIRQDITVPAVLGALDRALEGAARINP